MSNATLVNFAAGETSPRSRGRFDLAWFKSSAEKFLNYIPEVPGSARYRPGFKIAGQTRGGGVAVLIPFQLNDSQAYMLEFTSGFMRVYKNGALQTIPRTTVTGITRANPAVITVASTTGLANGDEITITDIVGMVELNGRQVKLAGSSGSTFQLVDSVTGANIDSTNFGAWTSGGTLVEIYEIASPYLEADLVDISFAQSLDTMYLAHFRYAARKVTIDSAEQWSLGTYSFTNTPFAAVAAVLTVTEVVRSGQNSVSAPVTNSGQGQTVVVLPSGSVVVAGTPYAFTSVGGVTNINSGSYLLEVFTNLGGGTLVWALLKTTAGANVNSAAWNGPYTSGGIATPAADYPIAVAFYEGRLGFFGTSQRPSTFFLSRSPSSTGAARYDDFTGGTDADHACFFTLAPTNGQVPFICWARGTAEYLFIGTFSGPFRVSGGGLDEPITPASINVKQIDSFGCEASAPAGGARPFFIQRGGVALRTTRYDADGKIETYDMLLNAEHIANSRLERVVLQTGRPDALWATRTDGLLAGMTVQGAENIAGWHRHKLGGVNASVLDVKALGRTDKNDQLWIVSRRVVAGITRCFVEIQADDVIFPDLADFYAGQGDLNRENDLETYKNAVYRRQEEYIHLDAAATYNGSTRGSVAAATLTPGATTGTGITFTASAAVFKATDVGNELWKKPNRDTGIGGGRAVITAYVSTTVVTCTIDVDFDHAGAIAAGEWHIAAETIRGLWNLEGQVVAVVTDGAVYSDGSQDVDGDYPLVTVTNGAITLTDPAAVVHVGLPYEGFIKTHNLALGGENGPVQNKMRNIAKMFIRFLSSLGTNYGTDLYDLKQIEHRDVGNDNLDRPAPVFTGVRELPNPDNHDGPEGKHVIVSQRLPLPSVIQSIDLHYDTAEES